MEYGYYEDIDDIFDARDMRESESLVLEGLWGQLEAAEEQTDELSHELTRLCKKLESIREKLEEISGGDK